jgi:hypothetical protein
MAEDSGAMLSIPFVTVTSAGGEHDDASYVAGFEMGNLAGYLATCRDANNITPRGREIHTENLLQADLIAMRYGYLLVKHSVQTDDGYTSILFADQPDVLL